VPDVTKVAIQAKTTIAKIPLYSNCAMAGFPSTKVEDSGNLKLYAVIAESAIAKVSGINMSAKITICCGFALSLNFCNRGFFIVLS
jgi:hypothetical protein